MKRPLLVAILLVAAAVGGAVTWHTLQRDREFQRLLAAGEDALAAGQTLSAIEAFSGAIALRSDSMAGWLRRGETHFRQGDLEAAARDLGTAAALDPAATRPIEGLGDVRYTEGRYAAAATHYEAYLRLDEQSSRLLYKLALARYREGRTAAALEPLRRSLQLNDRYAEAHHLLGLALRRQNQPTEAIAALRRAIQIDPALAPAREALAEIYAAAGRHAARVEQLEALAALDVDHPGRFVALALAQAEAGRADLAVLAINRAAERRPNDPDIYAALASVWLRLAERGDQAALRKALEASQRAVKGARPTSLDLLVHGRAQLLSGRLEAARRTLLQATSRLPVEEEGYLHLAEAASSLGHASEARQALLTYVTLTGEDRSDATLASRIAALSMRLNDAPAAIRWLTRAVRLQPENATLQARLAEAHLAAGHADAAREALERAIAAGVDQSTPLFRRLASQMPKG